MKVAVTGAAGQLGTQLLQRLVAERSVSEIVALDLQPPLLSAGKLKFVRADVRDPQLGTHLAGCDALVHLAFVVARRAARPLHDDINVNGSKNVFRAALAAGVRRIVYASSVAAYGVVEGHPKPIVESTPRIRQPDFWYAAAKFDVEAHLDELERANPEVAFVRFRPAILIGRRMEHRLGVALRKGVLPDLGTPDLPIVWDEDVADAFLIALQTKPGAVSSGEVRGAFNLCARELTGAAGLAQEAGVRHLRVSPFVAAFLKGAEELLARLRFFAPMDPGWLGSPKVALDYSSEKALSPALGWKPRYPTARAVMRRWGEVVPRKLDRRLAMTLRMVNLTPARDDLQGSALTVHLDLTGARGGDYTLRLADRRLRARKGLPRPADARVELPAALFLELLAGKGDFSSAQMTGKVRVFGQPMAALVVQGIITGLRAAGGLPGARGAIGRAFTRYLTKGSTP